MPWPVKSTLMVSREREPVTGSTRTSTAARIGPSVPRTPQARGGSISTSSEVDGIPEFKTQEELDAFIAKMETEMRETAKRFEFEKAAKLRDRIKELRTKEFLFA